ncbi:MAG: peptidylprolyl isomerase [Chitinivibrionales bacterium]|nr:peptidylprolyl isomerase [Chitinivibrionales bacterium]
METAQMGNKVKVKYQTTLPNHEFVSDDPNKEVEFRIGSHEVIPGLEKAVDGMQRGETREVNVKARDAFGHHRDDLVLKVNRANLPPDSELKVGKSFILHSKNGSKARVKVTDMQNGWVILDANHPSAGKNFRFRIKLVDIVE